jgi:hypothetical protein
MGALFDCSFKEFYNVRNSFLGFYMEKNGGSWGPPLSKVDLSLKTLFTYLTMIGGFGYSCHPHL